MNIIARQVLVTLFGEKVENLAEPLKRADLAMYQAKSGGT